MHIREDLSVSEASVVDGGSAVLAVFFAISDVGEPLQPYEAAFNTTIIAGIYQWIFLSFFQEYRKNYSS